MAKGESCDMALILAQTRHLTDEFGKLRADFMFIKTAILANYGEHALQTMNKDE